MPGKFFLASEDEVMERVQVAVSQLEISGQRLTLKAVCAATGFSKKGLYKYDRVKTFLGENFVSQKISVSCARSFV